MSDKTDTIAMIHGVVATNKGYIEQLNKLLATKEVLYVIPAVALQGLRSMLEVDVALISQLTESMLTFDDQLQAIVEKYKADKEGK